MSPDPCEPPNLAQPCCLPGCHLLSWKTPATRIFLVFGQYTLYMSCSILITHHSDLLINTGYLFLTHFRFLVALLLQHFISPNDLAIISYSGCPVLFSLLTSALNPGLEAPLFQGMEVGALKCQLRRVTWPSRLCSPDLTCPSTKGRGFLQVP